MDWKKEFKDFLQNGSQIYLQALSVDCVIFGFHEHVLNVLLLKWKDGGQWCLPGGFIKKEESVDDSAVRTLRDRTGLDDIFLQQFHVFGEPNRDKNKDIIKNESKNGNFLNQRFVTVGYYALVEFSKVTPIPDWLSEECKWFEIHKVPKLIYDHNSIVRKALQTLRLSLNDYPVGYNLLPDKFTMPELLSLYETILDTPLDRRNFQKKILNMNILERLKERKTGGAHKAPFLYRFDKKKYEAALKQGLKSGF